MPLKFCQILPIGVSPFSASVRVHCKVHVLSLVGRSNLPVSLSNSLPVCRERVFLLAADAVKQRISLSRWLSSPPLRLRQRRPRVPLFRDRVLIRRSQPFLAGSQPIPNSFWCLPSLSPLCVKRPFLRQMVSRDDNIPSAETIWSPSLDPGNPATFGRLGLFFSTGDGCRRSFPSGEEGDGFLLETPHPFLSFFFFSGTGRVPSTQLRRVSVLPLRLFPPFLLRRRVFLFFRSRERNFLNCSAPVSSGSSFPSSAPGGVNSPFSIVAFANDFSFGSRW